MISTARAFRIGVVTLIFIVLLAVLTLTVQNIHLFEGGVERTATFSDAVGLAPEAKVRIAGVNVGRVKTIAPTPDGAKITMQVADGHPLYNDAKLALRSKTLFGEKFVEITPGTPAAGPLDHPLMPGRDGQAGDTFSPYDAEQLIDSLGPLTQYDLGALVNNLYEGFNGRGQDVNELLVNADKTFTSLDRVLANRGDTVGSLLQATADYTKAFNVRSAQLERTIDSSDRLFKALASRADTIPRLVSFLDTNLKTVNAKQDQLVAFLKALRGFSKEVADNRPAYQQFLRASALSLGNVADNQQALGNLFDALTTVSQTAAQQNRNLASMVLYLPRLDAAGFRSQTEHQAINFWFALSSETVNAESAVDPDCQTLSDAVTGARPGTYGVPVGGTIAKPSTCANTKPGSSGPQGGGLLGTGVNVPGAPPVPGAPGVPGVPGAGG